MENTMQMTAQQKFEARSLSFAKKGIGFGAAYGMLWGLDKVHRHPLLGRQAWMPSVMTRGVSGAMTPKT